jgi:hypothetical protein
MHGRHRAGETARTLGGRRKSILRAPCTRLQETQFKPQQRDLASKPRQHMTNYAKLPTWAVSDHVYAVPGISKSTGIGARLMASCSGGRAPRSRWHGSVGRRVNLPFLRRIGTGDGGERSKPKRQPRLKRTRHGIGPGR